MTSQTPLGHFLGALLLIGTSLLRSWLWLIILRFFPKKSVLG